jgi:hypothetical protein
MPLGTDSPRSPPRRHAPPRQHSETEGRSVMAVAPEHLEQLPAEFSSICSRSRAPPAPQALSRLGTVSAGPALNIPEPREEGLRPCGETVPSSAPMSALTTEHYTLKSARSSTITEANGRSSLFPSAVSGGLLARALVAQLDRLQRDPPRSCFGCARVISDRSGAAACADGGRRSHGGQPDLMPDRARTAAGQRASRTCVPTATAGCPPQRQEPS